MTTATATPAPQTETTHARATRTVLPPVDIFETDEKFVVLADMPGVTIETLEVLVEADTLVLRGTASTEHGDAEYREFDLGEYRRVFLVTEDLEPDQIGATLADGVVRVEIPKSERLKPRRIPVNAQ
jgi:HSP20 family molecular chaperone IbpA